MKTGIWLGIGALTGLLMAAVAWANTPATGEPAPSPASARSLPAGYETLRRDVIINSDLWNAKPEIMAAGLGFTSIIGVPNLSASEVNLSRTLTELAGGTWNKLHCGPGQTPSLGNYTSAVTPSSVRSVYGQDVYYSDGLPVEFSWPILPSTLDPSDFRVRLNNGTTVTPQVTSTFPNYEYNERSVAVMFGHFGNRIPPGHRGAIYPVRLMVVKGASTLELVGPHGKLVSAVGFSVKTGGSPYTLPGVPPAKRGGPVLVAAKLSRMSVVGDTAPLLFRQDLPNNGVALYGRQAKFRLRVYTSGGMTPNGVSALLPTDYNRYFVIDAVTRSGKIVRLTQAGKTYFIDGHPLRVVGLADLGRKEAHYGPCYSSDNDNYIDIVLDGSAAAASRITTVQIPSTGRYKPLYNPGGPGNNPAPGVHYSAPSPPISQPVTIALRNPLTVTYVKCPDGRIYTTLPIPPKCMRALNS
ncbi:MAG TPA: hypothetical protein VMA95_05025 [Streptosporangiaceae bacterium]|nr:hypothetical protein [Streptosporangiaceae bacterium]